jgi:hypothetical protein
MQVVELETPRVRRTPDAAAGPVAIADQADPFVGRCSRCCVKGPVDHCATCRTPVCAEDAIPSPARGGGVLCTPCALVAAGIRRRRPLPASWR